MVKEVKKQIRSVNCDIIFWGYNWVKENGEILKNYFEYFITDLGVISNIEALELLIKTNKISIWTCSAAYKRELLVNNNIFFHPYCTSGEDLEFIYKSISKSKDIKFIPKVLSFYVQREGSITNSYNIKRFDSINAFLRSADYLKNDKKKSISQIGEYIDNYLVIENYLNTFNSCVKYVYNKNKSIKKSVDYLINDIDKAFPDLRESIGVKIIDSKSTFKKKLKFKIYVRNPRFYTFIISKRL